MVMEDPSFERSLQITIRVRNFNAYETTECCKNFVHLFRPPVKLACAIEKKIFWVSAYKENLYINKIIGRLTFFVISNSSNFKDNNYFVINPNIFY